MKYCDVMPAPVGDRDVVLLCRYQWAIEMGFYYTVLGVLCLHRGVVKMEEWFSAGGRVERFSAGGRVVRFSAVGRVNETLKTSHVDLEKNFKELDALACVVDNEDHYLKIELESSKNFPHQTSPYHPSLLSKLLNIPMAGGKQSRQEPGSSSSGKSDPRFLNAEDKAAYACYKLAGLTISKTINPATLSYPVMDLFAHTSLCFLLTLACPFNVELLLQFFASLRINSDYTSLQSYVGKRPVEINYEDFENILHLSTTGDKLHTFASDHDFNWTPVNQFLRNTAAPFHNGFTSGLGKDARTIQHILRSLVIPKAGDRIHITPLLSLTTFYIIAHREFNASDLIIRYFENLTTIRDPIHHRKPNLALGHLVSYVLTTKYNIEFPSTSTSPTHRPTFFSNNSFHILHSTRLHPEQGEAGEEAEEAQPEQAPDPIDQLVERFDAFETRFDTIEAQHQQFQTNISSAPRTEPGSLINSTVSLVSTNRHHHLLLMTMITFFLSRCCFLFCLSYSVLKVSTSARRNGSLPVSGGSKRSDGSLPASGGSERSSGSLPHRVGGKSIL
ncbi:hypothetical protein M5K25_011092 [Dendrobium thyrsiflorum]|uniref:Uncharacterized protein n=1 Tax=Dendrobium thyrsiflorum TaxID=117978 RepID=A0ABD0V2G5_DENTH